MLLISGLVYRSGNIGSLPWCLFSFSLLPCPILFWFYYILLNIYTPVVIKILCFKNLRKSYFANDKKFSKYVLKIWIQMGMLSMASFIPKQLSAYGIDWKIFFSGCFLLQLSENSHIFFQNRTTDNCQNIYWPILSID